MSPSHIHRITSADFDTTVSQLADDSTVVYRTDRISDMKSFFYEISRVLPLDPQVHFPVNWDAIADSLWEGLYTIDAERIALFLQIEQQFASELTVVIDVFEQVSEQLSDPEPTLGRLTRLDVYVWTQEPSGG